MIRITESPIDSQELIAAVTDSHCGAVVLFLGMTRQWTKGKETKWLEYEAYRSMAESEMRRLESEALDRWPIRNVYLIHRLGRVDILESSVGVAVGSPHREAAFAAGKWLIDELKRQVPIWKKEIFADQSDEWIHPHDENSTSDLRSSTGRQDDTK